MQVLGQVSVTLGLVKFDPCLHVFVEPKTSVSLLSHHLFVSVTLCVLLSLLPSPAYLLTATLVRFPLPFPSFCVPVSASTCVPLSLSESDQNQNLRLIE